MGWSCFQNGRPLPPKDRQVWQTFHWPSWERGSKEAIEGQPEEVTHHLQHGPQAVVWPCCWPCGLVPHNLPSCCPVQSGQEKFTQREETEEEGPCYLHHHTRHFFSLQTLIAALSLPHRSGQPQATSLQSTSTWTNFLNLCLRSQAMMMMSLITVLLHSTLAVNNLGFKFVS